MFSAVIVASASDTKPPGSPYLGQTPPGDVATIFAPGIISDGLNNRDIAITPDGSELYYSVNLRNFNLSTIVAVYKTGDQFRHLLD